MIGKKIAGTLVSAALVASAMTVPAMAATEKTENTEAQGTSITKVVGEKVAQAATEVAQQAKNAVDEKLADQAQFEKKLTKEEAQVEARKIMKEALADKDKGPVERIATGLKQVIEMLKANDLVESE